MAIGTFLLAKILGAEQFGIYSLVISYVAIIIMPIRSGLGILSVRVISSSFNEKIPIDFIKFSISTVIKYFIIIALIDLAINSTGYSPITNFRILFYIVAITTLVLAITIGYLQGLNHIIRSQYIEQLIRPVLFLILIATLFILRKNIPLNYETALIALSLSFLVSTIISTIYILFGRYYDISSHSKKEIKKWTASLIPLSFLTGLQVLLSQMDIIFLGQFQEYNSIAVYKIAIQFAIVTNIISAVIEVIIAPKINKLYFKNTEELVKLIYYSNWINFISGLLLIIFYYFISEHIILYLLSPEYRDASLYILILCGGYLISTCFGPISTVVNMLSLEKINLYCILTAVISNFILLLVLVPLYSSLGAAISTALSMIIWKAVLSYSVRNKIKFSCYLKFKYQQ